MKPIKTIFFRQSTDKRLFELMNKYANLVELPAAIALRQLLLMVLPNKISELSVKKQQKNGVR